MHRWEQLEDFARAQFAADLLEGNPPQPFLVAGSFAAPALLIFLRPFERDDLGWIVGEAVLGACVIEPQRIAVVLSTRLHPLEEGESLARDYPQAIMIVMREAVSGGGSDGDTMLIPYLRANGGIDWSESQHLGVPEIDRFNLHHVLGMAVDSDRRPRGEEERIQYLAMVGALGHTVAFREAKG